MGGGELYNCTEIIDWGGERSIRAQKSWKFIDQREVHRFIMGSVLSSKYIRKSPNLVFLPILRIFKDFEMDPKNLKFLKNI